MDEDLTIGGLAGILRGRLQRRASLTYAPVVLHLRIDSDSVAAKAIRRGQHVELNLGVRASEDDFAAADLYAEDPAEPRKTR
ncbi:MAG: hypothetical protein V3V34_11680 [Kiloniellales bacterium]